MCVWSASIAKIHVLNAPFKYFMCLSVLGGLHLHDSMHQVPEPAPTLSPVVVAGALLGGIAVGYALGTGKCGLLFSWCK